MLSYICRKPAEKWSGYQNREKLLSQEKPFKRTNKIIIQTMKMHDEEFFAYLDISDIHFNYHFMNQVNEISNSYEDIMEMKWEGYGKKIFKFDIFFSIFEIFLIFLLKMTLFYQNSMLFFCCFFIAFFFFTYDTLNFAYMIFFLHYNYKCNILENY